MARLERYFPKAHGKPRVDDRRVLSGIIPIKFNGLRWRAAPREYGPHKTLYNRWNRRSERGLFARIMAGVAAEHGAETTGMIGATNLYVHRICRPIVRRTAWASKKGGRGRLFGRIKGGMNTKLHAVCDSQGRPIDQLLTAGPVSNYIGARALVSGLPKVMWLLGDRGYDADWFREALHDKKVRPCIPGRKKRKTSVGYDKPRYKRCNRIETHRCLVVAG